MILILSIPPSPPLSGCSPKVLIDQQNIQMSVCEARPPHDQFWTHCARAATSTTTTTNSRPRATKKNHQYSSIKHHKTIMITIMIMIKSERVFLATSSKCLSRAGRLMSNVVAVLVLRYYSAEIYRGAIAHSTTLVALATTHNCQAESLLIYCCPLKRIAA